MAMILLWALGISLAINGLLFLAAFRLQSDKLTDASYALSFLMLAIFGFIQSGHNSYAVIGLLLVIIWALRIGGFLLNRVIKAGKDQRFDGMREHFFKFGKFWLAQAVAVWVLMIPVMLVFQQTKPVKLIALVGVLVWAIGFSMETTADAQKYQFSKNPVNKNKWIKHGVWQYSRHPNYFGEILVWLGLYLYVIPALPLSQAVVAIVSPIFITVLLLFVSGIPLLEKSADKKWGNLKAYQEYKRRTSILIPLPRKS